MNSTGQSLFKTIFLLVIAAFALTCFADTPPPVQPFTIMSWPALSKYKPTTGLNLGTFKVQFEETTLAMVIKAAGLGKIEQQGQTGEHILWVCYSIENAKQSELVWIISDSEMGGHEHAITGVSAKLIQPNEQTNDCPSLPSALQPISFENGVWLGITKENALKLLGKPSHQENSWLSFDYSGKMPGKCEPDGFDVMNWFLFKSHEERLTTILAGQVTSC